MFEKLSKVTTLLALLIAGSVIVLLVGFAAYLSPAWIQYSFLGTSAGIGVAFSYQSIPPLLFTYVANDFSALPAEFKVAEILFPVALVCVVISLVRIIQSRRHLKLNPSGLQYALKIQYQSIGLHLATFVLLFVSLAVFTSKAVPSLKDSSGLGLFAQIFLSGSDDNSIHIDLRGDSASKSKPFSLDSASNSNPFFSSNFGPGFISNTPRPFPDDEQFPNFNNQGLPDFGDPNAFDNQVPSSPDNFPNFDQNFPHFNNPNSFDNQVPKLPDDVPNINIPSGNNQGSLGGASLGVSYYLGWVALLFEILVLVLHGIIYKNILMNSFQDDTISMT